MTLFLRPNSDGSRGFDRDSAIAYLRERDGDKCQFPGCTHEWVDNPESPWRLTIDHVYPQARARREGWSWESIWDSSNLALLH